MVWHPFLCLKSLEIFRNRNRVKKHFLSEEFTSSLFEKVCLSFQWNHFHKIKWVFFRRFRNSDISIWDPWTMDRPDFRNIPRLCFGHPSSTRRRSATNSIYWHMSSQFIPISLYSFTKNRFQCRPWLPGASGPLRWWLQLWLDEIWVKLS